MARSWANSNCDPTPDFKQISQRRRLSLNIRFADSSSPKDDSMSSLTTKSCRQLGQEAGEVTLYLCITPELSYLLFLLLPMVDAVAPRDGRERSTMDGAGQRSEVTATLAWHAPMI
jgi:hypothetical protein